ncbi:hypothetical protein RCJ22_37795, partial [Vibrio sp. FNV 38]|nr:hypothetical protein [Vibrio sp. FNV 38]
MAVIVLIVDGQLLDFLEQRALESVHIRIDAADLVEVLVHQRLHHLAVAVDGLGHEALFRVIRIALIEQGRDER